MRGPIRALMRPLAARRYRDMPVAEWPARAAEIFQVKVPAAVEAQAPPSPAGSANINILFHLIDRTADVPGELAECGVFRGATSIPIALRLRQQNSGKTLHAFDSFEGFDDDVETDIALGGADDPERRKGGFDDTSLDWVLTRLLPLKADSHVRIHKGFFKDTLSAVSDERFSFVHLDCDIYQSYLDTLEFFYPRMNVGGIVLFDEYDDPNWPGCNKAIDEFMADKPEALERIERDGFIKTFFMKA